MMNPAMMWQQQAMMQQQMLVQQQQLELQKQRMKLELEAAAARASGLRGGSAYDRNMAELNAKMASLGLPPVALSPTRGATGRSGFQDAGNAYGTGQQPGTERGRNSQNSARDRGSDAGSVSPAVRARASGFGVSFRKRCCTLFVPGDAPAGCDVVA